MDQVYSFKVVGEPKPQPRARATTRGCKSGGARMYDPGTAKDFKSAVRMGTMEAGLFGKLLTGPLSLSIVVRMPRPGSHFHKSKSKLGELRDDAPVFHSMKKDDIDNISKAVMDAMNDAQVWGDDGQVCHLDAWKLYSDEKECVSDIKIRTLG